MITSIVGRLIKKPELVERINIPGKRVVNFTVVQNNTHGEKRLSVFFNLSLILGTDNQYNLAMRFEKGTVLLFSAPRVTYVRQSERGDSEQTINIYAEAENFKIISGPDTAPVSGGPLPPAETAVAATTTTNTTAARRGPFPPQSSPSSPSLSTPSEDNGEGISDPFDEVPLPVPSASPRSASQSPPTRPHREPPRRSVPPAPMEPMEQDLSDLDDPFGE